MYRVTWTSHIQQPTLGRVSHQEDGRGSVIAFLREALLLSEDLFELNEVPPWRTPDHHFLIIQKALLSSSAGLNKDNVENPRKRRRAETSSGDIEILAAQVKLASQELTRVQQECVDFVVTFPDGNLLAGPTRNFLRPCRSGQLKFKP